MSGSVIGVRAPARIRGCHRLLRRQPRSPCSALRAGAWLRAAFRSPTGRGFDRASAGAAQIVGAKGVPIITTLALHAASNEGPTGYTGLN